MNEDITLSLLSSQIRNSYGNVFWTHKTHEKDADRYRFWNNFIKIAQIVLSAFSTTGVIYVLCGINKIAPIDSDDFWVRFAAIASAIISASLVIVNSLSKGYDLGELSAAHGATAIKLLDLREEYLSLLYDIKAGKISIDDIMKKRDELKDRALAVYTNAPRTTSFGYSKAVKEIANGDPFFTKDSLNRILPLDLREY